MDINDTPNRIRYVATAGQRVFAIPFEFFANTDISVYRAGVLQQANDLTFTGAGVTGGGTVTLDNAATAGMDILIIRNLPAKRIGDFPVAGIFDVASLNLQLDAMTMMIRDLQTRIERRVIRLATTDLPETLADLPVAATRANKFIGFDANGQLTVSGASAEMTNLLTQMQVIYDNFDDRYLGAKASAPTVDNDGNALLTGALYFNTATNLAYFWTGTAWTDLSGPAGPGGAFWFTGAGAPTGNVGAVGDLYLDTASGNVHRKTGTTTWVLATNIIGPQGIAGLAGPQWIIGTGVPAGSTGAVNDWYIDRNTSMIYYKSGASTWTSYGELKGAIGPQGPQGIQGIQGPAGANGTNGTNGTNGANGAPGAVWRNGTGAPSNALGIDGDYYIDSATGDVYRRTSGTYQQVMNIKGPAGSGAGDMLKSTYDPDGDGKVSFAASADEAPWAGITGKPSTFTPSTHSHAIADVTGLQAALDSKGGSVTEVLKFITAGQDYVPPVGVKAVEFTLVGGGGGSGSIYYPVSSTVAGTLNIGGGGGGAYMRFILTGADIATAGVNRSFRIAVGAAGVAGVVSGTTPGNGLAGGATTLAYTATPTTIIATAGGGAGTTGYANVSGMGAGGVGGNPSYATPLTAAKVLAFPGGAGGGGRGCYVGATSGTGMISGGDGGGNQIGEVTRAASGSMSTGNQFLNGVSPVAGQYGCGGAGPAIIKRGSNTTAISIAGAAGSAGICIIREIYG